MQTLDRAMSFPRRIANIVRLLLRKEILEDDLDAEVRAYLAMLTDQHVASGLSLEQAQRLARIELEGVEQVKEQVREVRVGAYVESTIQDFRYALRTLLKKRGFAAIAILTLALGIGVNAAVFSVVYAVLLQPLPYDHPERLALIWSSFHKTSAERAPTSGPALAELQRRTRLFQDIAGIWVGNATFAGEPPEQVKLAFVTPNFLSLLGVRPALGRVFARDEKPAEHISIVLTHGTWKSHFSADPNIIGKGIRVAGGDATVAGVLPEGFELHFPADSNVPAQVGAFVPYGDGVYKRPRTLYFLRVLGRMKPGITATQAQQDLDQAAAQIRRAYTEFADENMGLTLAPLQADAVRDVRPALIALFAGAGFVLLICWVNVANLLLARSSDRRMEIAVRAALGATQRRITRQLLIEGLILCVIAATLGLALGWIGLHGLVRIRPDYLARMQDAGMNWPVLFFVGAISLAAVLLFGLAPSLESAKADLVRTLRESGRSSQTITRRSFRAALIVTEIALGFVLVIGACLMVRTLVNVHHIRPGFEPQNLLTFELDLSRYRRVEELRFVEDWETQLATLPGVAAVGAISHLPLDDYPNWYAAYRPEGVSQNDGAARLADHRSVTPGYFRAMGAKLLEGRFFDQQDRADGRQVIIVDELLARSTWPGQSALGKKIESEHFTAKGIVPMWAEVVGVIEHVRTHSLEKQVRGEIYIPFAQSQREHLSFALRTKVDPLSLADTIRRELHKRNPEMALSKVRPMTAYVARATAPLNLTTVLAGSFAALALLLAALGIYGLSSYSVSQRTHELGVRMALGASAKQVLGLVMREGLILTAAGMSLGIGGALLTSRFLKTLLYGVSSVDPLTYTLAIIIVPAAAILGCWRPARKAASTNPVEAIRTE